MIYCLICKKHTDDIDEKIVKTKNNRNMIKAKCRICGANKNKFTKSDFKGNSILNRIIDILPEMHMSSDVSENVKNGEFNNSGKYSYCGPGTKFNKRIKQGYKGVNVLDQACFKHDSAYNNFSDDKNRNFADNELVKAASEIANNPNVSEKVRNDAKKVAALISAKSWLGLGYK